MRVVGIRGDTYGRVRIRRAVGIGCIALWGIEVSEHIYFRPEVSSGGLPGYENACVVHAEGLMHTSRANIGDHRCQAGRELILYIEVPLRHVIAFGVGIGI